MSVFGPKSETKKSNCKYLPEGKSKSAAPARPAAAAAAAACATMPTNKPAERLNKHDKFEVVLLECVVKQNLDFSIFHVRVQCTSTVRVGIFIKIPGPSKNLVELGVRRPEARRRE